MDIKQISRWLLILGGLNWGALAVFDWEIGSFFGGMDAAASQALYIIVGIAAIYELYMEWGGGKKR